VDLLEAYLTRIPSSSIPASALAEAAEGKYQNNVAVIDF
jgi:hypothetical protein